MFTKRHSYNIITFFQEGINSFPVQISYQRTEINPQFVAIVPQSEVVVVITFDVEMGKAPMTLTICIPYSMIEPIRSKLDSGFQSDQTEEDTVWGNRFRENIREARINLKVELGKSDLTVSEFLKLKIGDILPLDQEVAQPLDVKVEDIQAEKVPGACRVAVDVA